MTGDKNYRAFISYSHADKKWGDWLHRSLETYRVPGKIVGKTTSEGPAPRRLTPIFRDRDDLAAAADLSVEIETALKASRFLVLICSPNSARSKWVNLEIKRFKQLHGKGRILAAIVDGEPFATNMPGREQEECFPEALRFKLGTDGELSDEPAEPIAADFREGGDGKKYARTKIAAGLIGVKLDDLIGREQQRRNQRMRVVAGGMGAIAAGFGALAWTALLARNEAQDQRKVAETERAAALAARDDAEDLIEFMLTDLRTRLNAVGRLDVLDSVGEKALEYYDARDLSSANPDALGRRARAQLLVGEIDNTRGDLDAALEAYEAAAATTEEQLRRDPDNPQRIFDHSQSVFWVGYIAWQRGDAETARGYFTQYHDQAKQLVEIDPENDDWQMELNYAYSNLGTLELDNGSAAEAGQLFQNSLKITTALARKRPQELDRIITQGQAYAWLADALHRQSKLAEARAARHSEISLYEKALVANTNHATFLSARAIANYRLAQIEIAAGQLSLAREHARAAVRQAEDMYAQEPGNTELANRTSMAYAVLGEINFHLGRSDDARSSLEKSISIAEHLVAQNDNVINWTGLNLAKPSLVLARVEAAENHTPKALRGFGDIAAKLHVMIESKGIDPIVIRHYCSAHAGRARLSSKFENSWAEIIAILAPQANRHGPEALAILAEAYTRIGKTAEATMIVSKLHAAGYRHPDFQALLAANPALLLAASGEAGAP